MYYLLFILLFCLDYDFYIIFAAENTNFNIMTATENQKEKEQALKEQFAQNLKERIKVLCKGKGLTQNDLAEKMGLGSGIALHTTIRKGNLRLVTLQKIADALGVEIVDLLSPGETEKERLVENKPVFHCPHCGKEVVLTLSAPLNQ